MSSPVDQDQKWLIECLTATLDTSREVRSFAEASLQQASLQPGYGAALTKITVNKDIPFGLRQISFSLEIILRIIHQLLLPTLDDPNRKIRTAISMAIVSIAEYDWPDDWPELLPFLLKLISAQNNISGGLVQAVFIYFKLMFGCYVLSVHGALKCFALLSGNLDDTLIETGGLMLQMINSLMDQFSTILRPPLQPEDLDGWSMKMEVLKCLLQLVQHFPSLVEAQFSVILPSLWQTFVSSLDAYQISSVHGTEDLHSGRFDSDGNERSLDAFVIQLLATLAKMDRRIANWEARLGHVDAQLDLKLDGLRMSRDSLVVFDIGIVVNI
ncbi:hypothetical protein KSP39_PZI010363 [Platanthera zijinensis]|uniref:Importin N-terminal domain-containing protein n=1 Tax=Platanthera zijinensis TaxID=2320716 RepID=A0AAP0BJQ8_9ASPA